jgi:hypothetical protein
MQKEKPNNKPKANSFIRYSSLGFEMMAIIAGFTFLGYKIDHWMNNHFKAFTLGLMVFSVVVAIIYGTKNLLKKNGNEHKKE